MHIKDLKPLTVDQYDRCRDQALQRVKSRIGEMPQREEFKRDFGSVFTPLDTLALIVFVAALLISSVHIVQYMGELATHSFDQLDQVIAGIRIDREIYAVVHQVFMIALAEASALLFMVMHGMAAERRAGRSFILRYVSIPLILALVAVVFIFVANWHSGIGFLGSIMPPIFTVGLGLHLESLIVKALKRREDINTRYLKALDIWEKASADPETHPTYQSYFKQSIWAKLVSLKANQDFKDAPAAFKNAACMREMERDLWVASTRVQHSFDADPPEEEEHEPTNAVPFGSIPLAQVVSVNGRMNGNGRGHGTTSSDTEV